MKSNFLISASETIAYPDPHAQISIKPLNLPLISMITSLITLLCLSLCFHLILIFSSTQLTKFSTHTPLSIIHALHSRLAYTRPMSLNHCPNLAQSIVNHSTGVTMIFQSSLNPTSTFTQFWPLLIITTDQSDVIAFKQLILTFSSREFVVEFVVSLGLSL